MWDVTTPFGARVERRLAEEWIIWLVTQGKGDTPQPSPVWFLREGNTLLIYSKPDMPKLRNIARAPNVSLHFDGDGKGGDIIVFTGTATLDPAAPTSDTLPAYQEKYSAAIARIGMSPERFAHAYSVAIRVTITSLRGH
jgi:PPOX class probable F420-dependent enzyme